MDKGFMAPLGVAFQIGPISVHWYGILISFAFALGIYLAYRETLRQRRDPDHLFNILLLLIPAAVIGARAYYVLFQWQWYAAHPEKILATWEGGLAIHGGVIAGILVILLYCYKKRQDFLLWADILSPSLILGQAIGRWGNFANAEAYGPVISPGSFWSWVPLQVMADGAAHHPTFLYESVWNALIFIGLLVLIRRDHRIGYIFASYLIFYSLGRFFIESLRADSLMLGSLRVAMLVSVIGVLAGAFLLSWIRCRPVIDVSQPPDAKAKKASPNTEALPGEKGKTAVPKPKGAAAKPAGAGKKAGKRRKA